LDRANGRRGAWIEEEEIKLKYAVQTHGGKDWVAIATLVPGRTKIQCFKDGTMPSIAASTGGMDVGVHGQKKMRSS
jgi:hypothetical protein